MEGCDVALADDSRSNTMQFQVKTQQYYARNDRQILTHLEFYSLFTQ